MMLCLPVLLAALAALAAPALADFQAPVYTVDLDRPPEKRWEEAVLGQVHMHGWDQSFKPVLDYIDTVVPPTLWAEHEMELRKIAEPIIGEEATAELRGIAASAVSIGHNISLAELEFFQVFYEILMECTGVLARDAEGGVVHGRNMDIGLAVTNLTAQVEWKKHGKVVMTSTQYLGYTGVHTGMRHDGWSVQANERVVLTPGPGIGYKNSTLALTALAFAKGHSTVGNFLRSSLLKAATFEEALPLLENTPLASPMYLIVGGKVQGRVIT
jgi:hypothetical protein